MSALRNVRSWLAWKWAWAKEMPLVWVSAALICWTVDFICFLPGPTVGGTPSDLRLRIWALALQIVGSWVVFHDLTSTARQFGKGPLRVRLGRWLRDGVRLRPKSMAVPATGTAAALVAGFSSTAFGQASLGNRTLEQRLEQVEAALMRQQEDHRAHRVEVAQRIEKVTVELRDEIKSRHSQLVQLEQRVEEVAVGNYSHLLFGASWALIGTVLSAIAPEVAKIAGGQWRLVLVGL